MQTLDSRYARSAYPVGGRARRHGLIRPLCPRMKRAFSCVAPPSWRQAARDVAMREKAVLNEAGWRVGIPLALMWIDRQPASCGRDSHTHRSPLVLGRQPRRLLRAWATRATRTPSIPSADGAAHLLAVPPPRSGFVHMGVGSAARRPYPGGAMREPLDDLDAFLQEHRRCGERTWAPRTTGFG